MQRQSNIGPAVRALLIAGLSAGAGLAQAQSAPVMKWIVPYPPGGVTDQVSRFMADRMTKALGQTIVIENRPGAGSRIGTDAVAKGPTDGNTLLFTNSNFSFLVITNPKAPLDPVKALAPVSLLATYGVPIISSNSIPASTLQEFVDYAKKNPGKLSYGSAGIGSAVHFFGEYFKILTGTSMEHVPYKSTSEALTAVVRGELAMAFDATAKPMIDDGRVKLLAVTSRTRDPRFPKTPTALEAGLKDFVLESWQGILAPTGTPQPAIERVTRAANAVLAEPDIQKRYAELGMVTEGGAATQLSKVVNDEIRMYQGIARQAKIQFD